MGAMVSSSSKFLVTVGLISLIHAAFSAAQHRSYLRLTEQEFHHLPLDLVLQGVLGLLLTVYGVLFFAGDFKEIRATVELESKYFETVGNRPSFYTFSHRGRALSGDYSK